jgi:hypothetical protein
MDEAKANIILATPRVPFDETRNLQGSAAIQTLIAHGLLAQATRAAEHERHALNTMQ